nr:MAG TPA: hypothetical protein [Caudoviricetes sp.]
MLQMVQVYFITSPTFHQLFCYYVLTIFIS